MKITRLLLALTVGLFAWGILLAPTAPANATTPPLTCEEAYFPFKCPDIGTSACGSTSTPYCGTDNSASCAFNQRWDCTGCACVCDTANYPCSGCTAESSTIGQACSPPINGEYKNRCGTCGCPSGWQLCSDTNTCVQVISCQPGESFVPCLNACESPYILRSPASTQTGDIDIEGQIDATGDLNLGGNGSVAGDLYIGNGQAIRVDNAGRTQLNIGNWGTGGTRADLGLQGRLGIGMLIEPGYPFELRSSDTTAVLSLKDDVGNLFTGLRLARDGANSGIEQWFIGMGDADKDLIISNLGTTVIELTDNDNTMSVAYQVSTDGLTVTSGNTLDLAPTAGASPVGGEGSMYFDSDLGKFQCYQGGAWIDCITEGAAIGAGGGTQVAIWDAGGDVTGYDTLTYTQAGGLDMTGAGASQPNMSLVNTTGGDTGLLGPSITFDSNVGANHGYLVGQLQGAAGYFSIANSEGTQDDYLVVDQAGQVGIRTNNPSSQLDVSGGGINSDGGYAVADTTIIDATRSVQNVTGYSQTSGNFSMVGGGTATFATSNFNISTGTFSISGTSNLTGTVNLGDTAVGSGKTFQLGTSGAPIGATNGSMYYDTTFNKFQCREGGVWKDCISAAGGGTLTGSGTAGELAIWTGATTLGSTTGFEFRNNRLGINEANPGYPLDIGAAPGDQAMIRLHESTTGADVYTGLRLDRAAGDEKWFVGMRDAASGTGNDLVFRSGGSDRLRMTMSGNIGIGTGTPTRPLDVFGNAGVSGTLTANTLDVTNFQMGTTTDGYVLTYDSVTGYGVWEEVPGGDLPAPGVLGTTLYSNGSAWTSSNTLYNDGSKLVLGPQGGSVKVGLGITNPDAEFQVLGGNVQFSRAVNDGEISSGDDLYTNGTRFTWYNDEGSIRAGKSDAAWNTPAKIGDWSAGFGYGAEASGRAAMSFGYQTRAANNYAFAAGMYSEATGVYSTAMGYDTTAIQSGAVAIGYGSNAGSKYSMALGKFVETQFGYDNAFILGVGAGSGMPAVNDVPYSVMFATGHTTPTMTLRQNTSGTFGRVGIGTKAPNYDLDVNGTVNANQLCIAGDCQSSWPSGGGLPAGSGDDILRYDAINGWEANNKFRVAADGQTTINMPTNQANFTALTFSAIGNNGANRMLFDAQVHNGGLSTDWSAANLEVWNRATAGNDTVTGMDLVWGQMVSGSAIMDEQVLKVSLKENLETTAITDRNVTSLVHLINEQVNNTGAFIQVEDAIRITPLRTNSIDNGINFNGDFRDYLITHADFRLGDNGDLEEIKGVSYSWPSSQAAGSGYVLSNDGAGNLSWTAVSGGGPESDPQVGGITFNYVPRWTGSSLNTGTIYDNGTNVGIGDTTPSQKLDVAGYVRGSSGLCIGNDCRTSWPSSSGANTSLSNLTTTNINQSLIPAIDDVYDLGSPIRRWRDVYVGPGTLHIGNSSIDELTIGYSGGKLGLDALTVDTSGNRIGINDTTPSYTLDVNGTVRATSQLCLGSSCISSWSFPETDTLATVTARGSTTNTTVTVLKNSSYPGYAARFVGYNDDGIRVSSNYNGSSYGAVYASNNSSSGFSIYSWDGKNYFKDNTGIGTNSPSYLLDVAGTINANKGTTGVLLRSNGTEAIWYNGTYFSWGYGGQYNYFADHIRLSNGTYGPRLEKGSPSYSLNIHAGSSSSAVSSLQLDYKTVLDHNPGELKIGGTNSSALVSRFHKQVVVDNTSYGTSSNPYYMLTIRDDDGKNGITVDSYGTGIYSSCRYSYCTAVNGYGRSNDFYASGPGTNYGASSSLRWKSDIREIPEALDKVNSLRGVYFTWDEEHGGHHDIGLIAEEVRDVVPEVVMDDPDNDMYAIGLDYGQLTSLLIQAVKELDDKLDKKVAGLESAALRLSPDGSVVVPADLIAADNRWGVSSGWISCPEEGGCACPDGYYVTELQDRGALIKCHQL